MKVRPKIVVVGSGLGASIFLDALTKDCELVIIDPQVLPTLEYDPIYYPRVQSAAGLGGGTFFWHNGLIEAHASRLEPWFPADMYAAQLSAAYKKLSNHGPEDISVDYDILSKKYEILGFSRENIHPSPLYYPKKRTILSRYKSKHLKDLIFKDRIEKFVVNNGKVVAASAKSGALYDGDYFILSAGGISSPIILNNTLDFKNKEFYIKDHPTSAIANIKLKISVSKYWNYKINKGDGFIRCPFVYRENGMEIAFYLRPNVYSKNIKDIYNSRNYAAEIRNNPLKIESYINLAKNPGDIYDAMSIQFGLNVPSHNYTVFCVAEMTENVIQYSEIGDKICLSGLPAASNSDIHFYEAALQRFLRDIAGITEEFFLYPGCWQALGSSAHLYGASRRFLGSQPSRFLQVSGIDNLKVVDASAIGDVGFVNTGLTIAVAARVAAQQVNMELSQ